MTLGQTIAVYVVWSPIGGMFRASRMQAQQHTQLTCQIGVWRVFSVREQGCPAALSQF